MRFSSPLVQGTLIKRYKRFLADIQMPDGKRVTAHCPNTGTMLTCSAPDSPVCLSRSANPKRKYPYTLEMIKAKSTWVGVNTARTNSLVIEGINKGQILEFQNIDSILTEVKTSDHTRLDLLVKHEGISTYIEIKNCSLAVDGCAMFPDAVTTRGTKHLKELARLSQAGWRACIFFLVQRMDAERFSPAFQIDPIYSEALLQAAEAGVTVLVYQAEVNPLGISIIRTLPHSLL